MILIITGACGHIGSYVAENIIKVKKTKEKIKVKIKEKTKKTKDKKKIRTLWVRRKKKS